MEELWVDVVGYEGLYKVSNHGNILGIKSNKVLKPKTTHKGYKAVTLCRNALDRTEYLVHRVVATAFVQNPLSLPQVNHIDERKSNNASTNLHWCSQDFNNAYSEQSCPRKVLKVYEGRVLEVYESITEAAKLNNASRTNISQCCNGHKGTHKGYGWKYA